MLFLERAVGLLRAGGALGALLPAKAIRSLYAGPARRMVLGSLRLVRLDDYSLDQRALFEEELNMEIDLKFKEKTEISLVSQLPVDFVTKTLGKFTEYKNMHLPIGSGVTEAACKTIFTQRLKLSGMRWTKTGAQTILNLRVILLSRIWDRAYEKVLTSHSHTELMTYEPKRQTELQNAA